MARSYAGADLSFVASGPNDENWEWTRGFLEEIVRKAKSQVNEIFGLALHYYAWNVSRGKTTDWNKGKGDAVNLRYSTAYSWAVKLPPNPHDSFPTPQ